MPTIKNYSSLWHKLAVVLCVCFVLGLGAGCASQSVPQSITLQIGVSVYDQSDTFIASVIQQMESGLQQAEEDSGLKFTLTIEDGRSNQTVQLEQIDQFIATGCDVLCVNIVDRTGASVVINKAQEANIPVIFFNRQPVDEDIERWEQVYYVGAKGEDSGQLQGESVRDLWQDNQEAVDVNGDGILQYVMLEGEQGHQDALLRTQYSISTLVNAGIGVEKLAGDVASWSRGQATEKMTQWLRELDQTVEVVFANNDEMALGAIDAYLSAGYDVADLPVVVGVDAIADALSAIASGTMAGTVLNDSQGMAQAMLDLSLALRLGQDPNDSLTIVDGHYIWLPYQKITAQDIEE